MIKELEALNYQLALRKEKKQKNPTHVRQKSINSEMGSSLDKFTELFQALKENIRD